MTPFPRHAINLDGAFVDAKNIEGIELPPPAGGCGGAGLNQQNRAIGGAITRGAVRGRTAMKMAGQDEINTAPRESSYRAARLSHQTSPFDAVGNIERMMRHHYPGHARFAPFEKSQAAGHLSLIYPAILEGVRSRCVDPDYGDFIIEVGRFKVGVDIASVSI